MLTFPGLPARLASLASELLVQDGFFPLCSENLEPIAYSSLLLTNRKFYALVSKAYVAFTVGLKIVIVVAV